MQEIFKFLQQYWQVVLGAILFVVSLIIAIIRKKPVSDFLSWLYGWCISGVKIAETTILKGDEKLKFVVDFVIKAFKDKYPDAKLPVSVDFIEMIIENILTTPQKKGE